MNYKEKRNRQKEEAKTHILDYLHSKGIDTSQKFHCPDPSHIDEHPSASIIPDTNIVKCFSHSGEKDSFDLIDIIKFDNPNMSDKEAIDYAIEFAGVGNFNHSSYSHKTITKNQVQNLKINTDKETENQDVDYSYLSMIAIKNIEKLSQRTRINQ